MSELNWFCIECKRLNISCDGNTNPVYSGCVYRELWLDRGKKVKAIKTNKIGIIREWDWVTNNYFVCFNDKEILPFRREELKEAVV